MLILKTQKDKNIFSKLNFINDKKVERFSFKNKNDINKTTENINKHEYFVKDVNSKIVKRNPSAPFTTSTLQQTSSGKFGFGASRTMQIAQRLYQGIEIDGETIGLITYMRTDGTNISNEAVKEFRSFVEDDLGKNYLPDNPNSYKGKKAKNAQEAHEAIRPTDIKKNLMR